MNTINQLMLPEILIASFAILVLSLDVFITRKYKLISYITAQLSIIIVAVSICYNFKYLAQNIYLFNNSVILNYQINFFKLMVIIFLGLILFYSKDYLVKKDYFYGEYLVLNLLIGFGLMILISSYHFLNFYLGLEMCALPIYGLIALEAKEVSLEAAVKYFVAGAMFSGILLYGLSLIYGATGTLNFQEIAIFIDTQHITMLFNIGLLLVLMAMLFKLNLVPLHIWAPEVYFGSATSVGMLVATLPKMIIMVFLGRMINEIFPIFVKSYWQFLLICISLLSLVVGNIGAILQTNFKKLLAYASVAHSGFMLLGFIPNTATGRTAVNLYVIVYSLTIMAIFGVINIFHNNNYNLIEISELKGLYKKHPWLSSVLLVLLLSLAGIPLTVGFYPKFLIIKSLVDANYTWLAIIGLIITIIGLFYYLRIIKTMFFMENLENNIVLKLKSNLGLLGLITLKSAIILGVYPILINCCLTYLTV